MKKILLFGLASIVLLLANISARAQYILNAADKQYDLFNYIKAIELYEQGYKQKATLYAAERLGACYKLINDYKQAESWYAIAAAMPASPAENTLLYAKSLQQNSKYNDAKIQFQKYSDLAKDVTPTQKSLWILSCDSAIYWMRNPTTTIISNDKKLNSAKSDWGAVAYNNGVVFASDKGNASEDKQTDKKPFLKFDSGKKPDKVIYGWTGNHYLKLYSANSNKDSVALFALNAETNYHVGSASFMANGEEMYFTLTRIPDKPIYVKGKLATINIEIYSSKKGEDGKWQTPVPFKYNNVNEYSVGDPFITKDGNSLYFVSNLPGGMGGTDLYVSQKTDQGEWGLPVNLKELNTEGNERSPSFDNDNSFYFSTDGRVGMGGLDIFTAKIVGGKISQPKNLGYPTNSPQDDFAFNKTTATNGFLSSNRVDGLGEDDIYSFVQQQILAFKLKGKVLNKKTGQPLANAIVTLKKVDGQSVKVETDEDGAFKFNLEKDIDYGLTAEKTDFRTDVADVTTKNLLVSTTLTKDLYLESIEVGLAIRLENIYYNFDKWNIRPDAATELDKLVKILKDNPTIWIELGSHTDSRGNDTYNMNLSQKRAESAVAYIISKGIDKNRITAKGYGENQPVNKCVNGVKCSSAEYQMNRRTEFKIVKK